jgi:hypothetical protein
MKKFFLLFLFRFQMIRNIFRRKKQLFFAALLFKFVVLIFFVVPHILREIQRFERNSQIAASEQVLQKNKVKFVLPENLLHVDSAKVFSIQSGEPSVFFF